MSGSDYTTTPNLGLFMPNYDMDDGTWGAHLNENASVLDAAVGALQGDASQWLPMTNPATNSPGFIAFPTTDPYQSPDSYALTGSMTVRGQPYGYYDTGTLLSLVSTTLPLSSSRAGVNSGFENGVNAIAADATFDAVNIYSGVGSTPPPLVLHNVTYDATHVIPHPSLTTAQIAVLRKNMWVLTNSIDTTVSTTPAVPNGLKPEIHYGSYVTGWASDGSSITVVGWTVPGSGHTAAGQVPPVGTLDPGAANATAYFGSASNVFAGNMVLHHDPDTYPDSRSRDYQGIEFDFVNYGTTNYQMRAQGLSLNYSPIHGALLTADSYAITLSGFPTAIQIGYSPVGLNIQGASTVLNSQTFNIFNDSSPPIWAGSPLTNLTWEAQNYIDSNVMRLQCWASRDSATAGWQGASMHLGLRIDGTPLTMAGGSLMAQLVWNAQGWDGGLQLQNQAGVAGLSVDASAYVYPRVVNAANDAAAATAGVPVGAMYRNGSVLQIRVT